ncbi:MAG TPA: hypothetical protein VNF73_00620 [Candidatus Saccharimonadales bacterium]|nr:hypothetical protein [Candidatus Saccharimonadales bacterium]
MSLQEDHLMATHAVRAQHESADHDPLGTVAHGARGAAEGARDVAGEIVTRLPGAAASTRDVVGQANVQMRSSSNETLIAGASLSLGLAIGLLVAGSNRLLVVTALIPAAAMGATLMERRSRELAE